MALPDPPQTERSGLAEFDITDFGRMAALARAVAGQAQTGDFIGLIGELGSGKTAFAREFIRALGGPGEEVPSPTFNLVLVYAFPGVTIWHFDLYRLQAPEETVELGLEDALAEGISLVEWPDRFGYFMPDERLDIEFRYSLDGGERVAVLTGYGNWMARLNSIAQGMAQGMTKA
jgi:tRNA threonylcarbamoyladenosine biosynthesis protein TsaE